MNALISITRTIFVAIVLTLGSMYLSKDINDLALHPIERMIKKVLFILFYFILFYFILN